MRSLIIILTLITSANIYTPITFAQEQPRAARAQELFEQGNAAISRGDFDSALSLIEEALKIEPSWAELHLKLGVACRFNLVQSRDVAY